MIFSRVVECHVWAIVLAFPAFYVAAVDKPSSTYAFGFYFAFLRSKEHGVVAYARTFGGCAHRD